MGWVGWVTRNGPMNNSGAGALVRGRAAGALE